MTPGRGVRTLANQPRGFDRELTRDFAKRESVLRFEVERWRARAESLNEENELGLSEKTVLENLLF